MVTQGQGWGSRVAGTEGLPRLNQSTDNFTGRGVVPMRCEESVSNSRQRAVIHANQTEITAYWRREASVHSVFVVNFDQIRLGSVVGLPRMKSVSLLVFSRLI